MRKLLLGIATLALALTAGAPLVIADHGDKHGHGNKHADQDDQGWNKREGYEYRTYAEPGKYPPGWSHGKKTGWGNCGLPPGQAKKDGCRTYIYDGRPYYYYQNEGGAIFVRRPVIQVQGGVTITP